MSETTPATELGVRIRAARKKAELSQAALGAKLHVTREAVSQWESGDNAPTSDKLGIIAAETNVPSEWLISGRGSMDESAHDLGQPNARPVQTQGDLRITDMPQNLPIMGAAACGDDGLFEFNRGDPLGHARRPPRLLGIRDAYAVYVCGDSMIPWREPGDLVYVNPHQPTKLGDYVLVQLKPQSAGENPEAYVKRLIQRTASHIKLLQYNPRKEFIIKTERIHTVHRILDWPELMGF